MGLCRAGIRFLLNARACGADFTRSATIGRQSIYANVWETRRSLRRYGHELSLSEVRSLIADPPGYAEPLLRLLGASTIASFDASEYEGATDIVDFNEPVDTLTANRFSVVIDGGSLEHVFNYAVGLRNAMNLVAEGGHLIIAAPAQRNAGHGFYQLSPELFFRALSAENGFEVIHLAMCKHWDRSWFEIIDPAILGRRVLNTDSRLSDQVFVLARRTSVVPIFNRWPQQSDYVAQWQDRAPPKAGIRVAASRLRSLQPWLPRFALEAYSKLVNPRGLSDRDAFRRIEM